MKKNIILVGPPNSGKGTLAKQLMSSYSFTHISTGDMFREAISAGTELGILAKSFIDKGDLVPDEVTIGLVKERISKDDCKNGFLLDGFPRTVPQAQALATMCEEINLPIDAVINVTCEREELFRRVLGRRVCRKCGAPYNVNTRKPKVEGVCDICGGELYQRADDNEEALKVRLDHYEKDTKPILDFYQDSGLLGTFDGAAGMEKLFDQVSEFLKK